MYLFARSARLAPGRITDAMTWAVNITEKVNQLSETPVTLWSTVFSPGVGTLAWTAIVEELSVLEATDAKMMADSSYVDLVNQGAAFASADAIDDVLTSLVVAARDPSGPPPAYASVVRSVLAPGAMTSGIEVGAEIAQRAGAISGCPTSFGVNTTGVYGGVVWITGCESIEQLQHAGEAINADADFVKLVDSRASKAYLAGVTTQTVYRKIS